MGRVCPRVSQRVRGYFTSQGYPLLVLELMAFEATVYLLFIAVLSHRGTRLPHGVAPSMLFPTHGYRGVTPSMS